MLTKKRQKELKKRADLHIDAANLLIKAIFHEHAAESDTSLAYITGKKDAVEAYKEELDYLTNYIIGEIKSKWGVK